MSRPPLAAAAALVLLALPAAPARAATPTGSDTGIRATSYGAYYDPAKCTVSNAYWKGHRRFYVRNTVEHGCFTTTWWKGAHPVMLSFGRTAAPWYPGSGVHHGVDIDMPVGTPIYSRVNGTAKVRPSTMGRAYGTNGLLVRSGGTDYVLGHMSRLVVRNNQAVKVGQLLGYSGISGVEDEDGPHLHFEVRPAGRGYLSATNPWKATGAHRV